MYIYTECCKKMTATAMARLLLLLLLLLLRKMSNTVLPYIHSVKKNLTVGNWHYIKLDCWKAQILEKTVFFDKFSSPFWFICTFEHIKNNFLKLFLRIFIFLLKWTRNENENANSNSLQLKNDDEQHIHATQSLNKIQLG